MSTNENDKYTIGISEGKLPILWIFRDRKDGIFFWFFYMFRLEGLGFILGMEKLEKKPFISNFFVYNLKANRIKANLSALKDYASILLLECKQNSI